MKTTVTHTKLMILVIMSATIALSACKKDSSSSPSKKDLLTSSQWKITAFTADPGIPIFDDLGNITGYTTDVFSTMESCSKDDTFKLNSDNSVKFDEGASKCVSTDPQSTNGTWSLKTNDTVLTLVDNMSAQDYTIMELTTSTLKLKYTETDGSVSYSFTITLTH